MSCPVFISAWYTLTSSVCGMLWPSPLNHVGIHRVSAILHYLWTRTNWTYHSAKWVKLIYNIIYKFKLIVIIAYYDRRTDRQSDTKKQPLLLQLQSTFIFSTNWLCLYVYLSVSITSLLCKVCNCIYMCLLFHIF